MPPTPKDIPAQEPVKEGEHIFNATRLTALAIEWQKYNTAGEHEKALELLEEIVKGSTVMFERFAQFEGFDSTVDLPTLVLAAQEKIVKWLLAWRPEKGKLFSWFCLERGTHVTLSDGSKLTIGEIVDNKLSVEVLTENAAGELCAGKVVSWSATPANRKEWRKLIVHQPSGCHRPFFVTKDHPVKTVDGRWVEIDSLKESDKLLLNEPRLTASGREAIIGMYLGDGSIAKNGSKTHGYLSVSHGQDQRFYNDYICKKFRASISIIEDGTVYHNAYTGRDQDHSGGSKVTISAADYWEDFSALPSKVDGSERDVLTPWVLNQISPVSLAFWYMDDGAYSQKTHDTTLATCSFSAGDCSKLVDKLAEFGIVSAVAGIRSAKNGHTFNIIRIRAESHEKFFRLVSPFIIHGFEYKLPARFQNESRQDLTFVADSLVELPHRSARVGEKSFEVQRRFHCSKTWGPTPETLKLKYDIEVETHHNFLAGPGVLVHNSKCAKNVFKGEVVRANTYRTRIYSTGDSLEKFHGAEDHEAFREEVEVTVRDQFKKLTVRWGSKQEIGAVRFLLESIMMEDHDKRRAIMSACYGYGLSLDLSKFFYNWVLFAMRNELYSKAHVPFTEQDLVRHSNSYTHIPDLLEIIAWTQFKRLVMTLGGQRIKIPTSQQLSKLKDSYEFYTELEASDKDPASVEMIARRRGRTTKSAQEVWDEMSTTVRPDRSGEHNVYEEQ